MSHRIYDFLTESILFGNDLENDFAATEVNELKKALRDYREYVLNNFDEIKEEVIKDSKKISVTIESFGQYPDDELLKQLALYIDCVIIADPVFELTEERSDTSKVMSQYMGMGGKEFFEKKKLVKALKYMKRITGLIVCDYVKFVPISILHEAPLNIPIRFDKDNFRNCLPPEIMGFLHKHIKVCNTELYENGLRVCMEKTLEKGTGLYIYFPDCVDRMGEVVQYMRFRPTTKAGLDGKIQFSVNIADDISDEEFSAWLNQSINTASQKICNETFEELYFAEMLHSMYMTKTQFKADLLAKGIQSNSIQSKIANLALRLDVPVFQGVTIDNIIQIRQNYGDSFANFRSELGGKLIKLNGLKEDAELKAELDAVSYEINETYINNIAREVGSLKRSIGTDVAILTGTLLSSYATGGLTLIGAAAAAIAGVKDSNKLLGDVRENPGYFLWKIDKKKTDRWG